MNVPLRHLQLRTNRLSAGQRTHVYAPTTPNSPQRRRLAIALVIAVLSAMVVTTSTGHVGAQAAPEITFSGAGWGHGVGMSQYGARNMGIDGFSHDQILAQYFEGTRLETVTPPENIRVHLADVSEVTLSSSGSMSFASPDGHIVDIGAGNAVSISAHDGGLQIGGSIWVPAPSERPVVLSYPNPVKVSTTGHEYVWGKIQLTSVEGKVRVVEANLPMERYVEGIAEMPASWPNEALAAQAIAARTYAHYMTADRRADAEWEREFDIYGSTLDQNYEGWDARHPNWLAAVAQTNARELTYNGGRVKAYYSAANGGHTESSAYVFDLDLAYTTVKPDPYDAPNPWSRWTRTFSVDELSRHFSRVDETSVGLLRDIRISGATGGSQRLDRTSVELSGTDGVKTINGRRMMVVINAGVFSEGGGLARHVPSTLLQLGATPIAELTPEQIRQASVTAAPAGATAAPVANRPPAPSEVAALHQPRAELRAFKAIDDGRVLIDGWAFDRDAPQQPLMIDIFLDTVRVAEIEADGHRPGLGDRHPEAGEHHGFTAHVALTAGPHKVCLVARDYGELSGISLGCLTVIAQEVDGQVAVASLSSASG